MKLPEYVTVEEVKRVCKAIGVSDWSEIQDPTISIDSKYKSLIEAQKSLNQAVSSQLKKSS